MTTVAEKPAGWRGLTTGMSLVKTGEQEFTNETMILFSPLRVLLFFAFPHVYKLTLLTWKGSNRSRHRTSREKTRESSRVMLSLSSLLVGSFVIRCNRLCDHAFQNYLR